MQRTLALTIALILLVGCRTTTPTKLTSDALPSQRLGLKNNVGSVSHEEQSKGEVERAFMEVSDSEAVVEPTELSTLQDFEQLALATNPAIAEVDAEIDSLRGKLIQAGLPPNPVVGINGEDINQDGEAGRYGVFFGRQVVRGNKLELSRAVVCAEIETAQRRRDVVVQKLTTDIRMAFYKLLIAQERIKAIEKLVEISRKAVSTSEKLVEADEIARTSLLQAELELRNTQVTLRQAGNQRIGAQRQLAAFVGKSELPNQFVVGDVRSLGNLDDFENTYDQLIGSSPELESLFADIETKRRNLSRQIAEPIPNVTWQSTLQFDAASDDLVAGFQIGMPIPTLNRNEGAIHQATQKIVSAEMRAEKKVLQLRQRLTTAYQDYIDAQIQVDAFESEILPKAKETVELVSAAYQQGELPFLQWLTAQRTFSQTQLTYLNQLETLWDRNWAVKGMLLSGSLSD